MQFEGAYTVYSSRDREHYTCFKYSKSLVYLSCYGFIYVLVYIRMCACAIIHMISITKVEQNVQKNKKIERGPDSINIFFDHLILPEKFPVRLVVIESSKHIMKQNV